VVEVAQGEVWWASLPEPAGSGPGFRRPVIVVQGDHLNRSKIATVVCVPLTSNLTWADAPGNVLLPSQLLGLAKDSVANASQIVAVDREFLGERRRKPPPKKLALVMNGIDVVLGR
jgi:mRNA interferase MazF